MEADEMPAVFQVVSVDYTCRGLKNLGSTCYLNALLQCLAKLQGFRHWLRDHVQTAPGTHTHPSPCWACLLAADLADLSQTRQRQALTSRIAKSRGGWNPSFTGRRQQDASEAFKTLIDACTHEGTYCPQTTFCGEHYSYLVCRKCRNASERPEAFTILMLPFKGDSPTTIKAMMHQNSEIERIRDYKCVLCGLMGGTEQRLEIKSSGWPMTLVLHLKRFVYHSTIGATSKISADASYEETLVVDENVDYSLRAVLVHVGVFRHVRPNQSIPGHYTAYVRSRSGRWYFCNDGASPKELPDNTEALSAQAYMLFYERL
jgi:ubiquitin C-terminal hydrolase